MTMSQEVETQEASVVDLTVEERLKQLEERIQELEENQPEDRVTMVVFSGELDRVFAAFIIALGAQSMGYEVSMFFTFWGLNAIRKQRSLENKSWKEQMMSLMSPSTPKDMGVSNMNFFGIGAKMMRQMMEEKNVTSFEEMVEMTRDLGARFVSCGMSQMVLGINDEELQDGIEEGGVAAYLGDALNSKTTLFI